MPRLSSKHYPAARRSLRDVRCWLYELDPDEVLAVARFFAPSKPFTDAAALAHRRKATAADPSLPHRVGKILRKQPGKASAAEQQVARELGSSPVVPVTVGPTGREQHLIVRGVLRRDVDLRKLAQIISLDMRKPLGERLIDRIQKHDQDEAA